MVLKFETEEQVKERMIKSTKYTDGKMGNMWLKEIYTLINLKRIFIKWCTIGMTPDKLWRSYKGTSNIC